MSNNVLAGGYSVTWGDVIGGNTKITSITGPALCK